MLIVGAHWSWFRFSYGYSAQADVHLPRWLNIYYAWFELYQFAVVCWAGLLAIWILLTAGRTWMVRWYRQPRATLRSDRLRERFAARVFLISALLAGINTFDCPHARYFTLWRIGGIAWSTVGGPCRNHYYSSLHLFGPVYLFA